ncbi:MAG: hypothetical protein M3Y13_01820 [Armatimonadota bacterium]|nr:hypothetical protein [Armatimonadota bacterium]
MSVRRFGVYFLLLTLTSVVAFGQWSPMSRSSEQDHADAAPLAAMTSQLVSHHPRHHV